MAKYCAFCNTKLPFFEAQTTDSYPLLYKMHFYNHFYRDFANKQFAIGQKHTCNRCAHYIFSLFRGPEMFSASGSVFEVTCAEKKESREEAKPYLEKLLKALPEGEAKEFIKYALSVSQKIDERVEAIKGEWLPPVAKFKSQKTALVEKVKSQNRVAENEDYAFGIVDESLICTNYSTQSLQSKIEAFEKAISDVIDNVDENGYLDGEDIAIGENMQASLSKYTWNRVSLNSILHPCLQDIQAYDDKWTVVLQIPLDKIKHFKMVGSIGYSSEVHGGGGSGGGVNMGGAVAGGLLFGGVGAIIGSQLGTETRIDAIKTKVTEHDNRKVEFFYEDESGTTVSLMFGPSAYDCLMKLIPEKAFDAVVSNAPQSEEVAQPTAPASTSLSQLKELKELLDMGIISQEEFDAKKKQILGL